MMGSFCKSAIIGLDVKESERALQAAALSISQLTGKFTGKSIRFFADPSRANKLITPSYSIA
jgi:hypothetical protein